MERSDRDVDAFLDSLPDERRDDMKALDAVIAGAMDGSARALYVGKLWGGTEQEIIGYGIQTYVRSDGQTVTWFLVGLALQKHHLSIYINAVEDRQYLPEKYGKDLGRVKIGKSSIGFSSLDDIDVGKLESLVARARDAGTGDG